MMLRDFGRFGLFFLDGDKAAGADVLPPDWTAEASKPLYPTTTPGMSYGYQWWVSNDGSYRAIGIFGQLIRVDPARKLVIVVLSAWPDAGTADRYRLTEEYVNAVKAAVDKR